MEKGGLKSLWPNQSEKQGPRVRTTFVWNPEMDDILSFS